MSDDPTMARHIDAVRAFNRCYTRTLGLLRPRLYSEPLSLAEARVLFEIRAEPGVSARTLAHRLAMDRGQLSRVLTRLVRLDMVDRETGPSGRRKVPLHPTAHGLATMVKLDGEADQQAGEMLDRLSPRQRERLALALDEVRHILDPEVADDQRGEVIIREADSGDLGWIILRHREIYGREWGFEANFADYVLTALAKYLEQPETARSKIWMAERDGTRLGCVGVVENEGNLAQLRWFLVEPAARGLGVGKALLETALTFCNESKFQKIFLWTLDFLLPARTMYQAHGFQLAESKPGVMGGHPVVEEKWELAIRPEPDRA